MLTAALVAVAAAGAASLTVVLSTGSGSGSRIEPAAQRLEYRSLPGTCRLLTASALATYLPAALIAPEPAQASGPYLTTYLSDGRIGQKQVPVRSLSLTTGCGWTSITDHQDRELTVGISLYDGPAGLTDARQAYQNSVAQTSDEGPTRPVAGVGDQAAVTYFNSDTGQNPQVPQLITLEVRSSNVVATVSYEVTSLTGLLPSSNQQNLAGLADQATLARDVLAVLARPATAAPVTIAGPGRPSYSTPPHACRLISAATLHAYMPSATADTSSPDTPTGVMSDCFWVTPSVDAMLSLRVNVYGSAQGILGPQAGYETNVQLQDQSGDGTTVLRTAPVAGLGNQATGIYISSSRPASQGVTLLVRSGNAVIQLTYQVYGNPALAPPPARTAQLAVATALARAVLASLPLAG
jgi:hypothetical protein